MSQASGGTLGGDDVEVVIPAGTILNGVAERIQCLGGHVAELLLLVGDKAGAGRR